MSSVNFFVYIANCTSYLMTLDSSIYILYNWCQSCKYVSVLSTELTWECIIWSFNFFLLALAFKKDIANGWIRFTEDQIVIYFLIQLASFQKFLCTTNSLTVNIILKVHLSLSFYLVVVRNVGHVLYSWKCIAKLAQLWFQEGNILLNLLLKGISKSISWK